MADYRFLSTWCLDAPIGTVWDALHAADRYPEWWNGAVDVQETARGEPDGVAQSARISWRSRLPYTLDFELRITRLERPYLIEARATGDLEGLGTWRLYEGRGTAVVYSWNVRTTKAWMNLLGPLVRPALVWNHDLVMRRGASGLAALLGVELLAVNGG
jgi:hypothetical protein